MRKLADFHGTHGGYTNHKCRCEKCRDANAAWMRKKRKQPVSMKNITHGTESSYSYGCRCAMCTSAHSVFNHAAYLRDQARASS